MTRKILPHLTIFLFVFFIYSLGTLNAQKGKTADSTQTFKKWYAQTGALFIDFQENASVTARGTFVPGASIELTSTKVPSAQIGYYLNKHISISTIISTPVKTDITGSGVVDGLQVGSATLAPLTGLVNFHPYLGKTFRPFIGGGMNYVIVLEEDPAELTSFEIEDALAFIARGGIDIMITDFFGINFSASYIFASTTVKGNVPLTLNIAQRYPDLIELLAEDFNGIGDVIDILNTGNVSTIADIDVDPIAIQAGVVFRF